MVSCGNAEYGTLDGYAGLLNSMNATDIERKDNYQELAIEITVPADATTEMFPLILNSETVELIRGLEKLCVPPQEKRGKRTKKLMFYYEGPIIYEPSMNRLKRPSRFWFDHKEVPTRENVKVHGLI
jgi:hypothetical protein